MSDTVFNFAVDVVDRRADRPDDIVLVWRRTGAIPIHITSGDLKRRSDKVACMLIEHGVHPSDRVFILLPPCPEWLEATLGCMKAGAVAVFPDDVDGAEQLLSALVRSQATALIAHQSTAALLEALTPATGVTLKIIVGWERDGWLDYDRRVSMASADFEPVSVKADDVAVMYAPASEREEIRFYRHDDATFHNEWLDAFRDGRSISIREE